MEIETVYSDKGETKCGVIEINRSGMRITYTAYNLGDHEVYSGPSYMAAADACRGERA